MSAPFIFMTTHTIEESNLDEYMRQDGEFAEFLEANEPDLIEYGVYINDEQTEVTFMFVFPDAQAADTHMQVARDKIGQGLEITKTTRLEVYGGNPGPVLGTVLAANAEMGVPLSIKPSLLNGFSRVSVTG